MTTEEPAFIRNLLLEKGWKEVFDDINMIDPDYVYPILVGWVKEPSMKMHTAREAFEKETV